MSSIFHPKQQRIFKNAIETNSFSHAYIFSGPAGVGKLDFAMQIAKKLLNIELNTEAGHPDLHIYNGLDIAQARELKKKISLSPFSAQYKVVIINNARNINREAANAILKLLEEPSGDTIFFLIATNSGLVLPTIRSRCYEMKFYYVSDFQIEKEYDTKAIEDLRPHWKGRPAHVREFLINPKYANEIREYKKDIQKFIGGSINECFKIIEKYVKIDEDASKIVSFIEVSIEHIRASSNHNEHNILPNLLNIYKGLTTTNAKPQFALRSLALNMKR